MRLGIPCLIISLAVTGFIGYPNVKTIIDDKKQFTVVSEQYKETIAQCKQTENELTKLNADGLGPILDAYTDNVAIAEAISNFGGSKLQSITAVKGKGVDAINITDVDNASDVSYFTEAIDSMKFCLKYSSLLKPLKELQNSGIVYNNLTIDTKKKILTFSVDTIFSNVTASTEIQTENIDDNSQKGVNQ